MKIHGVSVEEFEARFAQKVVKIGGEEYRIVYNKSGTTASIKLPLHVLESVVKEMDNILLADGRKVRMRILGKAYRNIEYSYSINEILNHPWLEKLKASDRHVASKPNADIDASSICNKQGVS
jgi:hypothetical protein